MGSASDLAPCSEHGLPALHCQAPPAPNCKQYDTCSVKNHSVTLFQAFELKKSIEKKKSRLKNKDVGAEYHVVQTDHFV